MGRGLVGTLVAASLVLVSGATAAGAPSAPGLRAATAPSRAGAPVAPPSSRVALRGSALPQVRHAVRIGAPPATAQLTAEIFLRPRHAALLRQVATATSGRAPIGRAMLRQLFLPTSAQFAAVERYARAEGLQVTGRHLLSVSVRGAVAAHERAFGVRLGTYRGADGRVFRAPSGPTLLPRAIAPLVQDVGGLDTAVRLRPLSVHRATKAKPSITPSCAGPGNAQSSTGAGLLPNQLETSYGFDSLLTPGPPAYDGTGQTIGLVEFTDYKHSDITTFRGCYPAITAAPQVDVPIGGGTTDRSGAAEAELDIEVAQAAAPDANLRVYEAPNDLRQVLTMLDQMVADGVTVATDSWGECEPILPTSFIQAENTHLELAAAAGMSFFSASGDSGSSDCRPFVGSNALFTDDPTSQPFATSVGGTRLNPSGPSERVWNSHGGAGGGGISFWWPKPAYQVGRTPANNGAPCGWSAANQCREVPDIALNADPDTGYIIFCTAATPDCTSGNPTGWEPIGGTSGAAPLMAGMVADANESSNANGGSNLGFANPFLYANRNTAGFFRDITVGNNNIVGGTAYTATAGYDMASGLGSVNAQVLATQLAGGTPAFQAPHTTAISITGPPNGKAINYGTAVTFSGTLTDTTNPGPVAGAPVYLETNIGTAFTITSASGRWSFTLAKALTRNIVWHIRFLGSDAYAPALRKNRHLYVRPRLASIVDLPRSGTTYIAHVNTFFTFRGFSTPNMHGARVLAQVSFGGAYHTLHAATVGAKGKYSIRLRDGRRQTFLLRWVYPGGTTHPWLAAVSKAKRVKVI